VRLDKRYYRASEGSKKVLKNLPLGEKIWQVGQQVKSGVKGLVMPTVLWEEFGFAYVGPIDGHNINELESVLKQARDYSHKPMLVHIVTTKGKGYTPAEDDAVCFHGVSPKTPSVKNGSKKQKTYSQVFGETMLELAEKNDKLVAITAAMPDSYCLTGMQEKYPGRVFDVGICEQHAVTFAAGLATQGFKPVIAVYSTFLQRAFDQIIHDVCLQKLPVVFAIDRGGIVGDDGKTHQGTFDISYLSLIPNLIVSAPKNAIEFRDMLYTATKQDVPMAIRYPRGCIPDAIVGNQFHNLDIGRGEILRNGEDVAIFAIGTTVLAAMEAAGLLEAEGIQATVVNSRFAKPLDSELIINIAANIAHIVTVEENVRNGGFGSNVLNLLNDNNLNKVKVKNTAILDEFVEHGSQSILRAKYKMDAGGIVEQVLKLLGKTKRSNLIDSKLYSSVE
jgi:1-deoxy-D-xylulose-5-phosphate synthase